MKKKFGTEIRVKFVIHHLSKQNKGLLAFPLKSLQSTCKEVINILLKIYHCDTKYK